MVDGGQYHLVTMLQSIRTLASHTILFLIIVAYGCIAVDVEINANGEQSKLQYLPQQIQATFIINNAKQEVNLYWGGNVNSLKEGALQLYYGVLEPNGGSYAVLCISCEIIYLIYICCTLILLIISYM